MRRVRWIVAVALLGALVSTTPAVAAPPPAVVFDTDMDFDDAAALAYLSAQHKDGRIRLRAVTVENNAVGIAGLAGTQARCLLDRFGLRGVPVGEGPPGLPVHPSLSVYGSAVMATLVPPCPRLSLPLDPTAGARLLARVAREEADLRILATGSTTNLARALDTEPAVRRATQMTVNGGDFSGKADPLLDEGLLRDGTQDFNFSSDPAAARTVVAAGLDSLLLVANATDDVPLTPAYAARLQTEARTAEARFVASIANHPAITVPQALISGAFWWDPLTAVAADRPDVILDERSDPVIVRVDGRAAGRAEIGGSGRPIRYAMRASRQIFEAHFLAVLNRQSSARSARPARRRGSRTRRPARRRPAAGRGTAG